MHMKCKHAHTPQGTHVHTCVHTRKRARRSLLLQGEAEEDPEFQSNWNMGGSWREM